MKTITILLAAFLSLQFSVLIASNPENKLDLKTEINIADFTSLVPTTPLEADFSDAVPEIHTDLLNLAPLTPTEADFNDSSEVFLTIPSFNSMLPREADFE